MTTGSPLELRKAFGSFMTGVTVVTTNNSEGLPVGFTANSFTSVSLDPPLVLVCPAKGLSSFEAFNQCQRFAINILAEQQQDVSNVFARPVEDRFEQVEWAFDSLGCPIFEGVAASFSCSVHQRVDAGDHQVLIGKVEAFATHDRGGLGYASGGYFSLGLERYAAELPKETSATTVGAIIEQGNQVLLVSSPAGWRPPEVTVRRRAGSLVVLRDVLLDAGIDANFGSVYSVFENHDRQYSVYYRGSSVLSDAISMGEFVSVKRLHELEFATPAIAKMMNRWLFERQHGAFSLYFGDEVEGDVHPVEHQESL